MCTHTHSHTQGNTLPTQSPTSIITCAATYEGHKVLSRQQATLHWKSELNIKSLNNPAIPSIHDRWKKVDADANHEPTDDDEVESYV